MDDSVSLESLFEDKLACFQYKAGYRFSVDSVLLPHFISLNPSDQVLDLGAGCGVISLILSYRWPNPHFTCLELQSSLFKILQKNIELNNLSQRFSLIQGDLCCISGLIDGNCFDVVVCNPPFFKSGTGKRSEESEKAVAKHEIFLELSDVIKAAAFALKNRGRLAIVYPASRLVSLIYEMRKEKIEPRRLQCVHPYPGGKAELVLVEAVKGGGENLQVMKPFFISNEESGDYTREMASCYEK